MQETSLDNGLLSKLCDRGLAVQAGEPMAVRGDVAQAFSLGQVGFQYHLAPNTLAGGSAGLLFYALLAVIAA